MASFARIGGRTPQAQKRKWMDLDARSRPWIDRHRCFAAQSDTRRVSGMVPGASSNPRPSPRFSTVQVQPLHLFPPLCPPHLHPQRCMRARVHRMGPLLDLLLHGLELAFPSSLLVCFFGIFPTFPRTIWIATLHDEADVLGAFEARSMGSEWEARRTANVERNARTMRRLGLQPARAECEGSRCRTKRKRLGHEGNACRRRSARLSSSNAAVGTAPWESDVEKTKDLKMKLQELQIPGGWTGFEHELFRYQYMSEAALWTRMRKIKRLDKLKVSGWETVRLPLGTMDLKYKRLIRVACALGWLDPCI